MKAVIGFILSLGFLSTQTMAGEHTACKNPFWDYAQQNPNELREIATSCSDEIISNLYFSRAYHKELLNEYQKLSRLEFYRATNDQMYLESQNMLIGLSEAFAYNRWKNGEDDVLGQLIDQYDQAIETTEYLIRGNEVLARNSYWK